MYLHHHLYKLTILYIIQEYSQKLATNYDAPCVAKINSCEISKTNKLHKNGTLKMCKYATLKMCKNAILKCAKTRH